MIEIEKETERDKERESMFDVPPKCPALANKLSGLFGWRHTYKVAAKHEGIPHGTLHKSYSLTLPKRPPSPSYTCVKVIPKKRKKKLNRNSS